MFPLMNVMGMVAAEATYSFGEPWLEELIRYVRSYHAHFARSVHAMDAGPVVLATASLYLASMDYRSHGMDAEPLIGFMPTEARVWRNKGQEFKSECHGYMSVNLKFPRATIDEAIWRLADAAALNSVVKSRIGRTELP